MAEKNCPICGGTGWLRPEKDLEWWEEGFGDLEPCQCHPAPDKLKKAVEKMEEKNPPKPEPREIPFPWETRKDIE